MFRERLVALLRENGLFLFVVGGIVAAVLLLRTRSSAIASIDEFDAVLRDGQPTLVEFYSNT